MLAITTFAFLVCKIYFLKVIGVGIAIAVVLDASIVRMVLVPASIKLMGEYNFYCPKYIRWVVNTVGLKESDEFRECLEDEELMALQAKGKSIAAQTSVVN